MVVPLPVLADDVLAVEVGEPPEPAEVEVLPAVVEAEVVAPVEPVAPVAPPAPPCTDVSLDPHAERAAAPTTMDKKVHEMVFTASSFPGRADRLLRRSTESQFPGETLTAHVNVADG